MGYGVRGTRDGGIDCQFCILYVQFEMWCWLFFGRGSRSERRVGDGGNVLIRTGQEEWPGWKDKDRAGRSPRWRESPDSCLLMACLPTSIIYHNNYIFKLMMWQFLKFSTNRYRRFWIAHREMSRYYARIWRFARAEFNVQGSRCKMQGLGWSDFADWETIQIWWKSFSMYHLSFNMLDFRWKILFTANSYWLMNNSLNNERLFCS